MKETNQTSLKDVLKDMVETYRLKNRLNQTKIQQLWNSVMGNSISRHTSDLKVRKNKLYITIESAPLRQELSFGRDKIRRMMNQELGEEYLEEVVIR
ncbi:MAG: DUF721 domain-containing protein [Saprospiraceae bacterium]|jgi:predicted nucleic acid-binding Zn ribbon protein|nr:DUF721 domain-containing protein [Saprospiraceae bacterium]